MLEIAFNFSYDQDSHKEEAITEGKNRAIEHIAYSPSHHFKLLRIFHILQREQRKAKLLHRSR